MDPLVLTKREDLRLIDLFNQEQVATAPGILNLCLTCGTCAGGCPATGVDGWDMRKAVRAVLLGLEQELIDSKFPWVCTLCGRCEHACPMHIDLVRLIRTARWLRPRDKVPGVLHKGVEMCLKTGNNVGIPQEDFLFLMEDVGAELAEELPGFSVPIDKKGAKFLLTINSKEPFGEPEDMKFWWKILSAANESWTTTSDNWEGVNWGLFTGDDEAMKEVVRRIVENYKKLECEYLLLPE
ncbi:MAG: 4Fe-4S dicluster domain-containing protein [Deltaproteobacteria bacterium]|jgi:heterodisulfide reductase subunit C|nr:4Fe-4S dicluster domain-containing protein [Deltaproteobacteria bacterium]